MPNTREKLIELLETVVSQEDVLCYGEVLVSTSRVADHLIANGVTIQKWIPVTERLPALHTDDYEEPDGSRMQIETSDNQWVVTASGYQTKARYETGVVFQGWVGEYGETIQNVTHWMSMPEPPVNNFENNIGGNENGVHK